MLTEISPDLTIISETFERRSKTLNAALNSSLFKSISYYRKNKAPGGGCAIIYNENRFLVSDLKISAPAEIKNCWALLIPKQQDTNKMKVKRIAVGSYYVSPRSKYKQDTIDHIIDTIKVLRAKFSNDVNFIIGGDFNRLNIGDILDSYGALKQVISVPTRNTATLEIILTDLHTMYHPPTTILPLQVDSEKVGKDGDHEIVILAPKSNAQYMIKRQKKAIVTRPLPESKILNFEKAIMSTNCEEIFKNRNINEQVEAFHQI